MAWLIAGLGASVVAMMAAAAVDLRAVMSAIAATFAAAVVLATLHRSICRERARPEQREGAGDLGSALRRDFRLLALTYAWGALALLGLYTPPLTGLRWQHGWQYALAMALLSTGAITVERALGRSTGDAPGHHSILPRRLLIAQGAMAIGGVAYLIGSGKLSTPRQDWAANQIFLYVALVVAALGAMALRTQVRRGRTR